jgi:hypothetical protein
MDCSDGRNFGRSVQSQLTVAESAFLNTETEH